LGILWLIAAISVLLSLVALARARRMSRRLDELSRHYWELRYQHGELRAHVKAALETPGSAETPIVPPRPAAEAFVPLSAVKR
jgi:hypothetical protein